MKDREPVLTTADICQPTKSLLYVLVVVILNVITDLYLLSIPLPVCRYPIASKDIIADDPALMDGQYWHSSQDHADGPLQWCGLCDYGFHHPRCSYPDGMSPVFSNAADYANQYSRLDLTVLSLAVDGPAVKPLCRSSYRTFLSFSRLSAGPATRWV